MIVLDTNVISEFMSEPVNRGVQSWLDLQTASNLWLSAISLSELYFGIERLPDGRKKQGLAHVLTLVTDRLFGDRVLPFDRACATPYSVVVTRRCSIGRPISVLGGQIAAICLANQATLATRNIRDFDETGIALINPMG